MTLNDYQRQRLRLLKPLMSAIAASKNTVPALQDAASRSGFSFQQTRRLYYAWLKQGDDALIDRRKLCSASPARKLDLTNEERNLLRQFALKCDSAQLAIEKFADHPETRPELHAYVARYRLKRNYPHVLRRAARVTQEERDQARGIKRFTLRSYTQLRSNTWIDSAGVEHRMTGGDLFECDDMSVNSPYWYEWPYGGDPLSDRFGVRLGRQMLASVDNARGFWLGFDLIGRVRDAYRAEDVLRFLGRIIESHGIPRLGFRLEKGVWAANAVRGVRGTNDEEEQQILASVRDAVDIHYVSGPKAKGVIEGSFDLLQSFLALDGIHIGRTRGEYEKTTQMMLACMNGSKHPKDCGFRHITEMAAQIQRAMDEINARPKLGRLITGIPLDRFTEDVVAEPLPPLPSEMSHVFLPVKKIRPVDGGHVRVRVPHYQHLFSFALPETCARLGRGYRLLVCFDPAEPYRGAFVFDAETEGKRDYESAQGTFHGVFPFAPDAPQIDYSGASGAGGQKKAYLAAARTHFRATGMRTGTGASIDQVADGRGNVARIERNGSPALRGDGDPAPHQSDTSRLAEKAVEARRGFSENPADRVAASQRKAAASFGRLMASEVPDSPQGRAEVPEEDFPSRTNNPETSIEIW